MKKPETKFSNQLVAAINKLGGAEALRIENSVGSTGFPDIICGFHTSLFFIETKHLALKLKGFVEMRPLQWKWAMDRWQKCGIRVYYLQQRANGDIEIFWFDPNAPIQKTSSGYRMIQNPVSFTEDEFYTKLKQIIVDMAARSATHFAGKSALCK